MNHWPQLTLTRRVLRPNCALVDPRFLLYWYLSPLVQQLIAKHTIHGATVPRIRLATMPGWPVSIPPLDEQRAIAEVLGALDDRIAANSTTSRTSLELIAAHYRRAKAADELVAAPFFDVLDVDFGEAFKGEFFSDYGVGRPLIRIRDLKTHSPQVWTREFRDREVLVQPGDVIVGMDAEFRASWWLGEPGLLNQRVCRVKGKVAGPAFVAMALREPLAAIESEKSGTTVIHLNKSDMARTRVPLPSPDALAAFEVVAEPLLRTHVSRAAGNRRLAQTRDSLLPLLMSGKVRVKDAEKLVEEAV